MSGSENPEFKGPPSLMSGGAADEKSQSNRILASLEGQVGTVRKPAATKRRRGAAALVLLLLCAASGAFWVMRDRLGVTGSETIRHAQTTPAPGATSTAALAAASTPAARLAAATDPAQAATIVNDSDTPASAAIPSVQAATPSPAVQPAASTSPGPAMVAAAGTSTSHPSHHVAHEGAPHGKASDTQKVASHPAHRTVVAEHTKPAEHGKKELARNDKTDKTEKLGKTSQAHPRSDDPDVDLLAVLIARTKPSVRTSVSAPRHDQLAEQLKQCDKLGFFASERCRQDTCAGQAGKDLDCPAVQASSTH